MTGPSFKAMGARASGSTLRRFESADIDPSRVIDLRADHPAVTKGRSIFFRQVRGADDVPRVLVSGHNNPKLGKAVLRGPRAGWPIFQLTLEERATCPATCAQWRGCYGNTMPFARRHKADEALMAAVRSEVYFLAAANPRGFLVRLHTLGDFFSVEYVAMWAELLNSVPALHVFGYTARREDDEDPASVAIATAIAGITRFKWNRFAIRTSHPEAGAQRAIVVLADPGHADVLMCPAQSKATEACATCGLCWVSGARNKTIGFLKHGMKRRVGGRPS